jgi:serine/threonine protein kinase/tetratricopeptide (TPR) repeat protein
MVIDEKAVFVAALALPDAKERETYLQEACSGDPELLGRLRELLSAHEESQGPLDRRPAVLGITLDAARTEGPGTVIGPYRLIEQIGEGGMGTVWRAQQSEPVKRLVAVKLIKAGMDSKQVIARFEAERQALALMDHPNIARVLDAGTSSSGRPYFVMDLVKGMPITRYCDEHHLTPRQRLELFIAVCSAVQHAHQKGIIHRDLKPFNVLVATYDGKPVPKVIDFGVAKAAGQILTDKTLVTGFGNIVGTVEYMSPEQAEFNQLDIDTRSDIYSLGVLLYELLTGSPPFSRKELEKVGMLEMLRVIREQEPSKPSTKLSTAEGLPTLAANRGMEPAKLTKLLRGELDWIVMRALEKDRSRRYETANGFAMDLQRYLADEPVLAGPPSARYRLRKFVRRNRGPVLAVTLLVLTLLAGIIGTSGGMVIARRRAEGERLARQRADANFALANEAVEKYLSKVTDDPDLKRADFHRLRKKLLESAIPFFQKIAEQKSDDPEVEARRGRAYDRLGDVRRTMGENEAAVQDSEAAQAIFVRLTADFPTVPSYRHGLANSHQKRARALIPLGRYEVAEAAYGQALDSYEQLGANFASEPTYRHNLATGYDDLGALMYLLGKNKKAEAAFRRALEIWEKLVRDFPSEPMYRQGLAASHNNLGLALADLGERAEAEAAYRRALDIYEKLVADFPSEPQYASHRSSSYLNLGNLLEGDPDQRDKAEAAFCKALDIQEKLADDFPTVPQYRHDLATIHSAHGILMVHMRKVRQAEAAFSRALRIWEKLAAAFPTVPDYRQGLATSHDHLGNVLSGQGKNDEAEAAYRQALDIKEQLVADFPNVPVHGLSLGGACCNFGILMQETSQPEAALAWFQKAISRLEAVLVEEPQLVQAREFLCNSHSARAQALDDLDRHAEAARDWERALELDDGGDREFLRLHLAESRLRWFREEKDVAGCLAAVAEYESLEPTGAAGLYNAACLRAICAAVIPRDPKKPTADAAQVAMEQADLAMAWLHRAVAAGFNDAEHITQDSDLDALRGREDFKKLLAELQAKKK